MSLTFEILTNDEVVELIKGDNRLVSGPNQKLTNVTIERIQQNLFNVAAFSSYEANSYVEGMIRNNAGRKMVGLAALGSVKGFNRGVEVAYISILPQSQGQGIGKSLARSLAVEAKRRGEFLLRHPTSDGAHGLTATWKSLAQELDLEVFIQHGSGLYRNVKLDTDKAKLFSAKEAPSQITFEEDGQELSGSFSRLETNLDLETMIVIMIDEGQGNFKPVTKNINDVKVVW